MTSTTRLQCRSCRHLVVRPADFSRFMDYLERVGLISCPKCGEGDAWAAWFREIDLKVIAGTEKCGVSCQQASSQTCKCECGGRSHGVA